MSRDRDRCRCCRRRAVGWRSGSQASVRAIIALAIDVDAFIAVASDIADWAGQARQLPIGLIGDFFVALETQLFEIADTVDLGVGHAGLIDETTDGIGAQAAHRYR